MVSLMTGPPAPAAQALKLGKQGILLQGVVRLGKSDRRGYLGACQFGFRACAMACAPLQSLAWLMAGQMLV